MRILITGAGWCCSRQRLEEPVDEHELHMADIDPLAAGLYLVPPDRRLIIPRGDTPELVPALHRACEERAYRGAAADGRRRAGTGGCGA